MPNVTPPDREALRLELQEGIVSFRHITTLIMQMLGIIVAADAVLISYGISQRLSAILLVASFAPIVILIGMFALYTHTLPIILSVMWIEEQLSLGEHSLGITYARMRLGPIYSQLRSQAGADEQRIIIPLKSVLTVKPCYILSCLFLVQFGFFLTSLAVYHYRFM